MKKIHVIFEVDENELNKEGLTFEGELGWLENSGIFVNEIIDLDSEQSRKEP